jgi:two-component system phosphate regulon response regulator PhoB
VSRSVLLIDDDPLIRRLLRFMLEPAGFVVLEAEGGPDVLDKVIVQQPDVILLNIMMPLLNGFTVCQMIRQEPRTSSVPIIMLSAQSQLTTVEHGLRLGANRYLTKPTSRDVLLANIRSVLVAV